MVSDDIFASTEETIESAQKKKLPKQIYQKGFDFNFPTASMTGHRNTIKADARRNIVKNPST